MLQYAEMNDIKVCPWEYSACENSYIRGKKRCFCMFFFFAQIQLHLYVKKEKKVHNQSLSIFAHLHKGFERKVVT